MWFITMSTITSMRFLGRLRPSRIEPQLVRPVGKLAQLLQGAQTTVQQGEILLGVPLRMLGRIVSMRRSTSQHRKAFNQL